MAKVNLPPIQIPRKILEDPELSKFFEAMTFSIYQLFQRTGGGGDLIQEGNEVGEENRALIDQNIIDIEENNIAIAVNIIDISTNAANIAINTVDITINTGDIADLKETFSWKTIQSSDEVTIGVDQQMIVADGINVDGSLVIDGELSLI